MFYVSICNRSGVTVADLRKKLALNWSEWSQISTAAKLGDMLKERRKQETTFLYVSELNVTFKAFLHFFCYYYVV